MANAARHIEITERRRLAVEMRNAVPRKSWQEIADALGYATRGHACSDVTRALAISRAGLETSAAEYRAEELAKLDTLEAEAIEVLLAEHPVVQGGEIVPDVQDAGVTLRAVQTILRIAERRAKLLGLDSPDRLTLSAPVVVRHILEGIDLEQL